MNCKIPKTNKDLKAASFYNWDAVVGSQELNVYCISGFPHSIGGRMGINELYCCPRGEKLTIDNIMCFSGNSCKWDVFFESRNYNKNKWDEERIEHNYRCIIYRNSKKFYTLCSYNLEYLMAKSQTLMMNIHEHAICFHMIDYEKEIINRKILWKQAPCIIISYNLNCNIMIVPDFEEISPEKFLDITKLDRDYYDNPDYSFAEDLFSNSISWFR